MTKEDERNQRNAGYAADGLCFGMFGAAHSNDNFCEPCWKMMTAPCECCASCCSEGGPVVTIASLACGAPVGPTLPLITLKPDPNAPQPLRMVPLV